MVIFVGIMSKHDYEPVGYINDYNIGDVVEAEVGVFLRVLGKGVGVNRLSTEELLIIPEPNQFNDKDKWTSHTDDLMLDLIVAAGDDAVKREIAVGLMKYVKDNYDYEEFERQLEEVREH